MILKGCADIEISSMNEEQKCRVGVYKIQSETWNSKPVFKHISKEEFLYHMKGGRGYWMVSS